MENLASLVRQAGFPEEEVPRMVAVAMAESGGNPRAHNPNASTGDNSYGLLQVNMLGRMGDERRRAFGLRSNEDLFDPLTNLKAARKIYDSQGIGAWGAWTNGSAAKYMDAARRAAGSPAGAASAFDGSALAGGGGSSDGGLDALAALGGEEGGIPMTTRKAPGSITGALADALGSSMRLAGGGDLGARVAAVLAVPAMRRGVGLGVDEQVDELAGALAMNAMGGAESTSAGATPVRGVDSGGAMSLIDFGKAIQGAGLRVGQHSAFGPVGKHSPNSHHYSDHAFDITDWNDGPEGGGWKERTKSVGELARQIFGDQAEIFHPGYDPVGGHHEHLHLAFPGGKLDAGRANQFISLLPRALGRGG